jgi:hypothetical protein
MTDHLPSKARKEINRERYERRYARVFQARYGFGLDELRVARHGDGRHCGCGYGCPPFQGCRHD